MTLSINIKSTLYNLTSWQKYKSYFGYGSIYPDQFRYTTHFGFEVLIGLKLLQKDYSTFKDDPQNCIWKVYTEDLNGDFEFIKHWYKEKYGTLDVLYLEIEVAKQRIDEFLLKYNKLSVFT